MKCYPSLPFLSIPPDSIQLLIIILVYNSLKKKIKKRQKSQEKKYKNEWKQEKNKKNIKAKNKQAS